MMKQINRAKRAAKRYLREVRRNLPCSFQTKRELLSHLQESLLDFVEERPHACYEDITERFGAPTDVADAYFAGLPAEQLRQALQTARFVRRVLTITCLFVASLCIVCLAIIIHENQQDQPAYSVAMVDQGNVDCYY